MASSNQMEQDEIKPTPSPWVCCPPPPRLTEVHPTLGLCAKDVLCLECCTHLPFMVQVGRDAISSLRLEPAVAPLVLPEP